VFLGGIQALLRDTGQRAYGWIFLPIMCWSAYLIVYRATGGHLNPVVSVVSLIRPDKPDGFNFVATILYIPAQFLGFFAGVVFKWYFDQWAGQLTFMCKSSCTMASSQQTYYWSEGTGLEFFIAVVFVLIFLSQTSRQTALSKDPACQSFIIAVSYGVLVIYSIDYAGGSLNFAYAFAQNFWNQVEYGQQTAFKFLGNYFICNL
jgi:glycerol uptake facilitator-like aquaporin